MKPEYHHFELAKYTSDPILCKFMHPFLTFEKASDTRHCHEDFYELVVFVDGTVLDVNESAKLSGLRDSSYLGRIIRKHLEMHLHEVADMLTHSGATPDVLIEKIMKS